MNYVETNSKSMEADITGCVDKVKSATDAATTASQDIANSVERFRKVKTVGDLCYYAAPIFVAIDMVLRIIGLIIHQESSSYGHL